MAGRCRGCWRTAGLFATVPSHHSRGCVPRRGAALTQFWMLLRSAGHLASSTGFAPQSNRKPALCRRPSKDGANEIRTVRRCGQDTGGIQTAVTIAKLPLNTRGCSSWLFRPFLRLGPQLGGSLRSVELGHAASSTARVPGQGRSGDLCPKKRPGLHLLQLIWGGCFLLLPTETPAPLLASLSCCF